MKIIYLLFLSFAFLSCRDRKIENKLPTKKEVVKEIILPKVNFYIEDGNSMTGFLKSELFKEDISTIITQLIGNNISVKLKRISNDNIQDIELKKITDVYKNISDLDIPRGNLDGSKFQIMLDSVLTSARKGNVSIFVSDFIQSSKDINLGLSGDYITTLIKGKINQNKSFGIKILKMQCDFEGNFYFVSNDRKNQNPNPIIINEPKPYYIWVFGDVDDINKLGINQDLFFRSKHSGFIDISSYENVEYDNDLSKFKWSILPSTNTIGTFRPVRGSTNEIGVHNISNVKPNRNSNDFQICIAADLSNIPVTEDYKLKQSNYLFKRDGFKLDTITKIDSYSFEYKGKEMTIDSKDRDLVDLIRPTHLIFLKSSEKVVSNLEFSLKKMISPCLIESNSINESDLSDLKTFGFENFTNAISKCYPEYNGQGYYFKIDVKIENNKSNFSWVWIMIVIVIIGVVVIIVKNKR